MSRVPHARRARLLAQAKINLSLRVLAREAGGHHQLETIFQRLTLGDLVTLELTNGERSLDVTGAETGPVERNLAWRAAISYAERTGWPQGWRIEVEKRIPVGGGMGGGSADAGAVLRLLDYLNPNPVGEAARLELAAGLGADVPFLACESPLALAWGRGERMLALPPLPARPVLLWRYPFPVSTAAAFAWLAADREQRSSRPVAELLTPKSLASWPRVAAISVNDLEAPVFAQYPELAAGLESLKHHSNGPHWQLVRMSGSGSTLFAIATGEEAGGSVPAASEGASAPRAELASTAVRVEEVELTE